MLGAERGFLEILEDPLLRVAGPEGPRIGLEESDGGFDRHRVALADSLDVLFEAWWVQLAHRRVEVVDGGVPGFDSRRSGALIRSLVDTSLRFSDTLGRSIEGRRLRPATIRLPHGSRIVVAPVDLRSAAGPGPSAVIDSEGHATNYLAG